MAELTAAQVEFIANPYLGILTTMRGDGTPHSTPVWVDYENGVVRFNTARGRTKERNIAKDSRVSIVVIDPQNFYRWVSVTGRGELVDEGADAHIDSLAKKYLGKDEYPFRAPGEQRVSVHIAPDRVDSRGVDE